MFIEGFFQKIEPALPVESQGKMEVWEVSLVFGVSHVTLPPEYTLNLADWVHGVCVCMPGFEIVMGLNRLLNVISPELRCSVYCYN